MRVVLNRQAEVALFRIARTLQDVLARSDQLDDCQREISKVIGIGGLALDQKIVERFGIRNGGKCPPSFAASSTMRGQRSGVFTMRRIEDTLLR